MSEAREKYYAEESESWITISREVAHDYVTELEQQLSELKESQTQKRIIKLCERLDKAERQNKQMIEVLLQIYDFQKLFDIDDEIIELIKNIIEPVKTNQLTSY